MTTRVIKTEGDIEALRLLLRSRKLPLTVDIRSGAHRTTPQNRLVFQWYGDIAKQLGDRTVVDVRRECKLTIGVPIMRAVDGFRDMYDRLIKPMLYADKLEMMEWVPVTSLMTTSQLTEYLDTISVVYSAQGVRLTDPEGRKYDSA